LNTETFSVRLDRSAKTRLQKLAKNTGRSRSFLAAEAISAYLDTNEWQVAGITKALTSLDRGKGIARARASAIGSLPGRPERRSPISLGRMTLQRSPESIHDLIALRARIAEHDPAAAKRVALHMLYCVEYLLSENRKLGAPGRVPGTRELVIPKTPYIVPYHVRGTKIEIARVSHASRRWPDRL